MKRVIVQGVKEFDEGLHPRDETGKFSESSATGAATGRGGESAKADQIKTIQSKRDKVEQEFRAIPGPALLKAGSPELRRWWQLKEELASLDQEIDRLSRKPQPPSLEQVRNIEYVTSRRYDED